MAPDAIDSIEMFETVRVCECTQYGGVVTGELSAVEGDTGEVGCWSGIELLLIAVGLP